MKKRLFAALKDIMNARSGRGEVDDVIFSRSTAKKLEKWIKSKGFCTMDQKMSEVAGEMGITKYELSGVCRCMYGESFLSLRKKLRIAEARKLLLDNPLAPISYIAERVGIPDRTNFRRQFYEVTGLTPNEYRVTFM